MQNSDIKLYVFERSIEMDLDRQQGVRKSIENERNKAGILLGFFFILLVQTADSISKLPDVLVGLIVALILFEMVVLYRSFCSIKMDDGVKSDSNFNRDWTNKTKEEFLHEHHRVIIGNIESQKVHLTKISDSIKYAVISIAVLVMILFLNSTTTMIENTFGDDDETAMTSGSREMSEPEQNLDGDDGGTMVPDSFEKGI